MMSADLVLVSNQEDLQYCFDHYHRLPSNTRVFHNGVFKSGLTGAHDGDIIAILFIGSWIPRKGIKDLVKVIPRVSQQFPHVRWCLAGTSAGVDEILSHFPDDYRPQIEVIPVFNSEKERELLANASIFVLPSYAEGQSLALLQAMEASLCCITTDCCGQRDIMRHGLNGLLFQAGDSCRLTDLLVDCITSSSKRRNFGKAAHASIVKRTWSNVANELVDMVEEAVSHRVP
jgi:glycosyltransferase involved in cell wall biosynthesis